MDDFENKNDFPESESEELESKTPDEETQNKSEDTNKEEIKEESLEDELSRFVTELKSKKEDVLEDDVQDWDGLIDKSQQDAEDFVINESMNISDEKLENIKVMEIDEDDERLCSICHRRLKMEKDGITYEYCKRCRNELLDTKYNWKSVLAFIASCVIFVLAVALATFSLVNGISVKKADKYLEKGQLTSAYNLYSQIVNSADNGSSYAPTSIESLFKVQVGKKTVENYLDTMFKLGNVQYIKTVVDKYYTEDELKKPANEKIKKYYETYDELFAVAQQANSAISALSNNENITKKDIDETIKSLEKLKEGNEYNNAFISYYEYYACSMLPDNYDMQLKYLDLLKQEETDLKVFYLNSYSNIYLCQDKPEECIKICDEALKENIEDFNSWRLKIKATYRQGKYDEALKLCEEALKIAKNIPSASQESEVTPDIENGYGVYLEQAVIYGIKGDMKKAQNAIDKAYQGTLTADTAYVYAMLCKKNGHEERYNEIISSLEQYQMTLPTPCQDYIDGKITFEDIFVKGKVEWYQ